MIRNPFNPGGAGAAPSVPQPGDYSPYASLTTDSPPADLGVEAPGDDNELRDYIAKAGKAVGLSNGKPSKATSDAVYTTIHNYAKRNPKSELGRNALEAAHANRPEGHTFPTLK